MASRLVSSPLRRGYIVFYNWIVFFGWLQVLYLTLKTTLIITTTTRQNKKYDSSSLYAAVETPLILSQSAAALEVIHSLTGIINSPITATLPQVVSRNYIVWGILANFPEIQTHFLVITLVISWSITEIFRYSYFGVKEAFGTAPRWMLWMRYSTFLVSYPVGIVSEEGLIYYALPYMKESGKYSIRMLNKWNFSWDYYIFNAFVVVWLYIPGFIYLFRYMLRQRRKALSKAKINVD